MFFNLLIFFACFLQRHYAENAGYFQYTDFLKEESEASAPITFYDSVTGLPLFIAPQGRTFEEFKRESTSHGWPSFRDNEVVWENVRVLKDGETVSSTGTHLGHNLPDRNGNRLISTISSSLCCLNYCVVDIVLIWSVWLAILPLKAPLLLHK